MGTLTNSVRPPICGGLSVGIGVSPPKALRADGGKAGSHAAAGEASVLMADGSANDPGTHSGMGDPG